MVNVTICLDFFVRVQVPVDSRSASLMMALLSYVGKYLVPEANSCVSPLNLAMDDHVRINHSAVAPSATE